MPTHRLWMTSDASGRAIYFDQTAKIEIPVEIFDIENNLFQSDIKLSQQLLLDLIEDDIDFSC